MQQIMSRTYVKCSPNQVNFATVFNSDDLFEIGL